MVTEICSVLYRRGIRAVPIGAMMRLMGISNERAQEWDKEYFALDKDFINEMEAYLMRREATENPVPPDATLH